METRWYTSVSPAAFQDMPQRIVRAWPPRSNSDIFQRLGRIKPRDVDTWRANPPPEKTWLPGLTGSPRKSERHAHTRRHLQVDENARIRRRGKGRPLRLCIEQRQPVNEEWPGDRWRAGGTHVHACHCHWTIDLAPAMGCFL